MEERLESQPLAGVRVLDLTHGIAGPYGTKLLADFGADVIKVERPGTGDYTRSMGPFPGDTPHPEKSGLFLHLNTNKRSVVLDLKSPQGVQVMKELVRDADILVESFKPGVMERLGLSYEALSKINPNLVMASMSNYGQTGPYRDYLGSELTFFATGGKMNTTGLPERYPLMLGGNHVQYQAGNVAAMALLLAWYAREQRGLGGQYLDLSIFETQMASINGRMNSLVQYAYSGERGVRLTGGLLGYPQGYYPCQDGIISVSAGRARWPQVVEMLGMPELLKDPRFSGPAAQADPYRREEFEGTIWLPWLLERTKQQVVDECQAHEILSGPINTIDDAMDNNAQADARGYFAAIDHPMTGRLRYPGSPIYAPKGWRRIHAPAPLLGEHTQEVLKMGWRAFQQGGSRSTPEHRGPRPSEAAASPQTSSRKGQDKDNLPLEGIRVLDMTFALAGPYSTMFLGDMGAEVIRLEPRSFIPLGARGMFAHPDKELEKKAPTSPYPNRDPGERPWNRSGGFNTMARNKRSITVELNTPEGKDVFRRLVEVSDIFVQNSVAGSMERLGFTYDVLSRWNPRFIMINVSGPGQTGPSRGHRGWGLMFESLYGWGSIVGYPDMDADGIPGSVPSDASTGITIVSAAVMALQQRERTGKGCFLDIALGETFAPHLGEFYMDYEMNKRVAGRLGNRHLRRVQGAYPCGGNDEWIAISLGAIEEWHALCRVMGRLELIEDERFADMQRLHAHHDEVDQVISEWTARKNNIWLFHLLQREGITAGPVMHEPMAYSDPHLKERGFFVPVTAPEVGTHLSPSTVFKMSTIPFVGRKPPVRLGEDNDYVYRQVLKLSEAEYDRLKALGQIGMDYLPNVP